MNQKFSTSDKKRTVKRPTWKPFMVFLFAVVMVLLPASAWSQVTYDQKTKRMTFGDKAFAWEEFREHYAEICKKNVITITGKTRLQKFQVIAPEGLSNEEICSFTDDLLYAMQGAYYLVGKYLREEEFRSIKTIPQPIIIDAYKNRDPGFTPATVFLTLDTPDIEELAKVLEKFKSKDAFITTFNDRLIIVDDQSQLKRLIDLAKFLDTPSSATKIYLWEPRYSDVEDVLKIVDQLFKPDKKGSELDALMAEERSNKLIVKGPEEACKKVLAIVPKLDVPIRSEEELRVVRVKFHKAEELSSVISNVSMQGRSSGSKTARKRFGEDLEVKVSADDSTNSLVLIGPPRGIEEMVKLIEQLDHFPRQVFLETVIMEMDINDSEAAGMSLVGASEVPGGSSVLLGTTLSGQNAAVIDPTTLMGLAVGAQGPTAEGVGESFNMGTGVPSFATLIRMLQANSKVEILANPFMMGMDGEDAEIIVGSNIPFITGTARDSYNQPVLSIQRQDVALTVKLKPEINEGERIKLALDIQIEDLTSMSEVLGPTTSKRAIKTTAIGQNGEYLALGGLLRDVENEDVDKVPVLGDIPILGRLFRSGSGRKDKVALMIFITPHVIKDIEQLRNIYKRKLKERKDYVLNLYGAEYEDFEIREDLYDRVGLVEGIRQTIEEEKQRLHEEKPKEKILVITPDSSAPEPQETLVDPNDGAPPVDMEFYPPPPSE